VHGFKRQKYRGQWQRLKHMQDRLGGNTHQDLEDAGLDHHDVSGCDDVTSNNSQEYDGEDPRIEKMYFQAENQHLMARF
jgi:hypothetical protein